VTLVKNVAPVLTSLDTSSTSAGPAAEGEPVTISGTFTDVGTLDTHAVTVDWGDGSVTAAQVTEAGGAGSFVAQHTYQFGGIYPVLVTLRDDDTGAASRAKTVFVTGVGVHEVGGLTSLQVVGTVGPDRVTINRQGNGRVTVHADFLREGKRTLPLAGLDIIQVVLLAGGDHAGVAGNVGLPAVLDGGDGDDHLNGGNGGSVVIGGRGDDHLNGGNARDLLIGGPGADRLVANGGDDILMGGLTAYDSGPDDDKLANDLSLLRLLGEWNSDRPYAERVANLREGLGPLLSGTGLGLRKGTTVSDDAEDDVLTGSAGVDWFFFDPFQDKLSSSTGGEETN
jgi:Ca2+-binding RTX toxin-like protein